MCAGAQVPILPPSEPLSPTPTVLVVDDNRDVLSAIRLLLEDEGMAIRAATSPAAIPAMQDGADVVVLDMNFVSGAESGEEGFAALESILRRDPDATVVLMTAYGDIERAVRALQSGAVDFVEKPWKNAKLVASIRAAAEIRRSRRRASQAESRASHATRRLADGLAAVPQPPLVGESRAMVALRETIARVAPTTADVLILGENGTGKELVASEIHRQSDRADGPFVRVDLGALPESLIESELFGVEKGAFTGAEESRTGRAELADGGTLFLDEVGNVPAAVQAKLLSLLERREVIPLGSTQPRQVDARVVSATNAPLRELADQGVFRRDLLYRLNTFEIVVPPLRARGGDIDLLGTHFLVEYAMRYQKPLDAFTEEAVRALRLHEWPGNVRELRHAVERAVILAPDDARSIDVRGLSGISGGATPIVETDNVLDADLKWVEREAIKRALERTGWNISQAARELGLSRRSLYRRLEEHGL